MVGEAISVRQVIDFANMKHKVR